MDTGEVEKYVSVKPSAYYFRKALREGATRDEVEEIGMQVVAELEALKEWVRKQGLIPPRRFILSTEAEAKGLTARPACGLDEPPPRAA